jgi:U2-associated protein SR140
LGKLRKGDIARVTSFAIAHASRGAGEVVDMIVANVEKPLSLTAANPEKKHDVKQNHSTITTEEAATNDGSDTSSASLVALYVVSDVLSSSSTSGVRHAWRFRQLFETSLRERKVFERLGMMAEKLGWGRLRGEKWKRSISLVLNLWEGWCAFPAESQELFVQTFESPPSLKVENKMDEASTRSKWKVVDALPVAKSEASTLSATAMAPLVAEQDDADGEPLDEDDVMGEPIDDEDVEGEPMDEDDVAGEPVEDDELETESVKQDGDGGPVDGAPSQTKNQDQSERAGNDNEQESAGRTQHRKRMRAVDLFADSDGSDAEK